MKKEKMKCEDLNIDMFDLLEGKLDSKTMNEFREHINICDICRARFSFIEEAIKQIDEDKKTEVTAGFADRVLKEDAVKKKVNISTRRILAPLAAAAVIVFGIISGMFISSFLGENNADVYADLPDEYYYTNEIHLETIETFFLINED